MNTLRIFRGDEAGAALAEYALLAALIAGGVAGAARSLGPAIAAMFQSGAAAFDSGGPAPGGGPPPPSTGGPAPGAG